MVHGHPWSSLNLVTLISSKGGPLGCPHRRPPPLHSLAGDERRLADRLEGMANQSDAAAGERLGHLRGRKPAGEYMDLPSSHRRSESGQHVGQIALPLLDHWGDDL